jgi:L-rhamnose isomerase/sugar isomerase
MSTSENRDREAYLRLADEAGEAGIDIEAVKSRLKRQEIETPSWGYADSGTRFGVFPQPGAAITIDEKLADAAQVHRFTGVAPLVAVHVLWDLVGDYSSVKEQAVANGVRIGSINPNVFQDRAYRFGSIANRGPETRKQAVDHMLDCIDVAKAVGSEVLSLWFADGTDYPGQDDIVERKRRAEEALRTVYNAMPPTMRMLVEYKPFEPGFYHTDIADWGMSYTLCKKCGDRALVLVDLGHHLPGTNIEHIVAYLLDEGMLGGFHFNNRKYADDDLMVGSINPYEFFLIYNELAKAETSAGAQRIDYMVDQGFNTKKKIPGMIQTACTIQGAYARALLVDRAALRAAQDAEDVVAAENLLMRAFQTDVEPLLRQVRREMDLAPDPLAAYLESGYQERIESQRGIRKGAGGLGQ